MEKRKVLNKRVCKTSCVCTRTLRVESRKVKKNSSSWPKIFFKYMQVLNKPVNVIFYCSTNTNVFRTKAKARCRLGASPQVEPWPRSWNDVVFRQQAAHDWPAQQVAATVPSHQRRQVQRAEHFHEEIHEVRPEAERSRRTERKRALASWQAAR